ncbi:unnamed protein product [Sphagnum jensenii]
MVSGEWSVSFLIEVKATIRPPLSSTDWETRNLSMRDSTEEDPCWPLLNVNFFCELVKVVQFPSIGQPVLEGHVVPSGSFSPAQLSRA